MFKKSSLLPHVKGIGDAAFDWRATQARDRTEAAHEKKHCEQSLFIEPVEWMQNDISQIEGKVVFYPQSDYRGIVKPIIPYFEMGCMDLKVYSL